MSNKVQVNPKGGKPERHRLVGRSIGLVIAVLTTTTSY